MAFRRKRLSTRSLLAEVGGQRSTTPSPERQTCNPEAPARQAKLLRLVDSTADRDMAAETPPSSAHSETLLLPTKRERGEEEVDVKLSPGGHFRPIVLNTIWHRLELAASIEWSDEDPDDHVACTPAQLDTWVRGGEDNVVAQASSALLPPSSSTDSDVKPSTWGVATTFVSVPSGGVNDGSDLDSDFDDEFGVDPLETTAMVTGRCRDIPEDEELEEPVREAIAIVERAMDDEADRMLGTSNSFTWQKDFESFTGRPETFSGPTPGSVKDFDTAYDSFTEIWDESIIEHIARETNRYAQQTIDLLKAKGTLKPSSRLRQWVPTDADEIMVLFAVYMYMAIDPRTSQNEYWQSNDYLELSKFKLLMTFKRYILLNKFLHFVDNSGETVVDECLQSKELSPKLAKVGPLLVHLSSKFTRSYNLARDIAIDESLTLFKGRLSWIQASRTKAAGIGMKSYELCESHSGYMYKFRIYTGKNSASTAIAPSTDLSGKSTLVVLDLLEGLQNLGHCVTMDNFYNSPSLARYLKSQGFDCLGTLRVCHKHVPNDIAKISNNVAKGSLVARHCGDVSLVAWKDAKVVTIISTYHNSDTYVGKRAGKPMVKPVAIRDYNFTMGGIDLKDQKLSMYSLERKRGSKWYMKLFKRLLNVSIHNAFVMLISSLNRRGKHAMTHRQFRYSLAKALADKHSAGPPVISRPVVSELTRLRKDVLHVPKVEKKRTRCHVCFRRNIEKFCRTKCVTCNEYLCFENCWIEWHSLEDLKGRDKCRRRRQ